MKYSFKILAIFAAMIGNTAFAQVAISQLPSATTPLVGTEIVPIVQSGVTKQVAVSNFQTSGSVSGNKVLASPNGSTGAPSFRALTATDMSALLGNANTWTAAQAFNSATQYSVVQGSVSGILPGCNGLGAVDDTACIQAFLSATPSGGTLYTGKGLYLISGALTVPAGVTVRGGGGTLGAYNSTCTSGFRTNNATQNAFVMAAGSTITGVCIDTAITKTAGTGIYANKVNTVTIADNAIYNQFRGISVSGASGGINSNQAVKTVVRDNSIITPNTANSFGLVIGENSTLGNTTGVYILNNYITCQGSNTIGTIVYDAGGLFMNGNNRYGCGTGTKFFPGLNQYIIWATLGTNEIIGDTDTNNDFVVDTSDSTAIIQGVQLNGAWISNSVNGPSILIRNTAGGFVSGIHISGTRIYANTNQNAIDIGGTVSNITIDGSTICSNGSSTGTGVVVGGVANHTQIRDNRIGACDQNTAGSLSIGISVTTSGIAPGVFTGNSFAASTTPINWAPASGNASQAVVANNMGLTDVAVNLASAATITLPPNDFINITGTTTITTINGGWQGRKVQFYFGAAVNLNTGGNICNFVAAPAFSTYFGTYINGFGCWLIK